MENIFYKPEGDAFLEYDTSLLPCISNFVYEGRRGQLSERIVPDSKYRYRTYGVRFKGGGDLGNWSNCVLWQLFSGFVDPVIVWRDYPIESEDFGFTIFRMRLIVLERKDLPKKLKSHL